VNAQVDANAVLSSAELRRLPPQIVAQLEANRRSIALEQAVAQAAYARSSGRFSELGSLLNGIANAVDEKAIADLHGRIGVEQAMLDNEQIKLAALSQIAVADRNVREQQLREAVTANHGSFATRFQPTMPVP
jgi:proline dehydrogenase